MIRLFYSYSHADSHWRDELEKHLSLLQRLNILDSWHDRKIDAGQVVDREISDHLKSADIILLLVSPDFLHSNYCYDIEMVEALRRQEVGEAVVIPVILRPCLWHRAPFGTLLAAPRDGKAVTQHFNVDEAFLDIAQQIEKVARSLQARTSTSPGPISPAPGPSAPLGQAIPTTTAIRSGNLGIAKKYTDYDQDVFIDEAFEYMFNYFQASLEELKRRHDHVDVRFTRTDSQRFSAVVYLDGKSGTQCMIFKGGMGGRGRAISFSHQISPDTNSLNESLYLSIEREGLKLKPLRMAFMAMQPLKDLLDKEEAAEYYWNVFMQRLR